jgi:hypothetical protein
MSLSIFCLVLILIFRLAFTLVFLLTLSHVICLVLLLVLCLSSLMDPTIAHMILVHERTALSLNSLVTVHVLIVVIVSRVGLIFLLEDHFPHFKLRHLDDPRFSRRGSRPTRPNDELKRIGKASGENYRFDRTINL